MIVILLVSFAFDSKNIESLWIWNINFERAFQKAHLHDCLYLVA